MVPKLHESLRAFLPCCLGDWSDCGHQPIGLVGPGQFLAGFQRSLGSPTYPSATGFFQPPLAAAEAEPTRGVAELRRMSPSRVLRSLSARLLLSESSRVLPDGRIGPRPRSDARSSARREERRWREGGAKRLLGLWRTQRQNGGRSARERLLQGALQ
ncbi:transmembrane protein 80 isoform X3 [Mesocricetus auratus]|uniref:Transmembrane protein 80 isoform X3 n=1 Tax=Mesocricetus auratus TaxID=10036 RepID=A0ABM2XXQ4_MESAU|nr:transmembrane protein 80 isoform X3 [Mesocricetus auratus]